MHSKEIGTAGQPDGSVSQSFAAALKDYGSAGNTRNRCTLWGASLSAATATDQNRFGCTVIAICCPYFGERNVHSKLTVVRPSVSVFFSPMRSIRGRIYSLNVDAINQLNAQGDGYDGAGNVDPLMYAQRVARDNAVNDAERAATDQSLTFVDTN